MKLVTLKTYFDPQEMVIDKSLLEDYGIRCFVKDEFAIQLHNSYSYAIGGIELQVKSSDFFQARTILKEVEKEWGVQATSKLICPRCQSINVDGLGLNGKISILIFALSGRLLQIFSNKFYCYDCTNVFQIKRDKFKVK